MLTESHLGRLFWWPIIANLKLVWCSTLLTLRWWFLQSAYVGFTLMRQRWPCILSALQCLIKQLGWWQQPNVLSFFKKKLTLPSDREVHWKCATKFDTNSFTPPLMKSPLKVKLPNPNLKQHQNTLWNHSMLGHNVPSNPKIDYPYSYLVCPTNLISNPWPSTIAAWVHLWSWGKI